MELTLKQAFTYFWQQIISKFVTADDIISDEMIDNICGSSLLFITTQPVHYYGSIGDTATFTVMVEGDGLTYQWQHRTKGSSETWNNNTDASARTNSFSIGIESHRLNYEYRCVITDGSGNVVRSAIVYMIDENAAVTTYINEEILGGEW